MWAMASSRPETDFTARVSERNSVAKSSGVAVSMFAVAEEGSVLVRKVLVAGSQRRTTPWAISAEAMTGRWVSRADSSTSKVSRLLQAAG